MDIFLYIIIFIIGTLFGSFYTLSVYRIPLKENIINKHSYCPNCGHKLSFFELIPILSYIFLGGKCHNCKQKIRLRYFMLEVLSGICFVIIGKALNISIYNININSIIQFTFFALYITFIFLVCGIDKEFRKIEKSLLVYGLIISTFYILYQLLCLKQNIFVYIIYLAVCLVLMIINKNRLKKEKSNLYTYDILILVFIMSIFTSELITIYTINTTLMAIGLYMILKKIKYRKYISKNESKGISIGFFLGIINISYLLIITSIIC